MNGDWMELKQNSNNVWKPTLTLRARSLVFLWVVVRNRRRGQLPREDGPQRRLSHLRRIRHHIHGHVSLNATEPNFSPTRGP